MKKILVIDDELAIRDLTELVLKREGFQVKTAENGRRGIIELNSFRPDLVLLDLMLPDCSGYDLCKEIVKQSNVPVIMVSAKDETIDKVLGLELGAEDYITKPFDNRELIARIKVILRRYEHNDGAKYEYTTKLVCGELEINPDTKVVQKNGTQILLTAKEYGILETLFKRPKKIFTRDELLEIVWGYDYSGDSRSVDMTIMRLRKKIEEDSETPKYVKTIYGFGYQLGGDST